MDSSIDEYNSNDESVDPQPILLDVFFHAMFHKALPLVGIFLMLGGFLLLPPRPASVVFLTGFVVSYSFAVARRPVLATSCAMAALALSLWLVRPVVTIQAASNDPDIDKFYLSNNPYFMEEGGEVSHKFIAVAEGIVTPDKYVVATLYHVKSGEVVQLNFDTGGRPRIIPFQMWDHMYVRVYITEQLTQEGRFTVVETTGLRRGGTDMIPKHHDVQATESQIYPRRLRNRSPHILYVEGDERFIVEPSMSVEDFAKKNDGNYLVVVVGLD